MVRPTHPNHPFTARSQRRGVVIVALVFLLVAAAITFTLTRLDRVPVQNPSPKATDQAGMLRFERAEVEAIEVSWRAVEPTATVSLGW